MVVNKRIATTNFITSRDEGLITAVKHIDTILEKAIDGDPVFIRASDFGLSPTHSMSVYDAVVSGIIDQYTKEGWKVEFDEKNGCFTFK